MPTPPKDLKSFESLLQIVKDLRGPDGCPWDKEQTPQSLTPYTIEEAYELVEAIESQSTDHIIEELGDLLLQVALHAEIARQEKRFDISNVLFSINEKMVRRHPHVFGNEHYKDSAEVLEKWQELKDQEKKQKTSLQSTPFSPKNKAGELLNKTHSLPQKKWFDIPLEIPALTRAQKMGQKSKKLNFDWPHWKDVLNKVEEEFQELKESLSAWEDSPSEKESSHVKEEMGDLLFSLAQLSRHLGFDSEQALRAGNRKFEVRFQEMRNLALEKEMNPDELSVLQWEELWEQVKRMSQRLNL